MSKQLRYPMNNIAVSSTYRSPERPTHDGLDMFGLGYGKEPILSAGDGIVNYVGTNGGYGKLIGITHDFGDYFTRYAHLDSYSVKVGDKVTSGQQIGIEGNTGTSTGNHLHFEVRKGSNDSSHLVNPQQYTYCDFNQHVRQDSDTMQDCNGSDLIRYKCQDRDTNVDQIEILQTINVRETAKTSSLDLGNVIKGQIFTVVSSTKDDKYTWYQVMCGVDKRWVATNGEWLTFLPKEVTDYKKLYEEQLEINAKQVIIIEEKQTQIDKLTASNKLKQDKIDEMHEALNVIKSF